MGSLKTYSELSCKTSTALAVLTLLLYISVAEGARDSTWLQDLCSYKWEAIDLDNQLKYTIKLCDESPSTACGPQAAICAQSLVDKTTTTVGELSLLQDSTTAEKVLNFNSTARCTGSSGNMRSSISFLCGKTMGTPEFVTVSECVHHFEWRTYAACRKDTFKPHKEVPCYAFDPNGNKHDLNPLIKLTDGYLVDDSDDNVDFYINICRSLVQDGVRPACAQGSAACLVTGGKAYNMGFPSSQLELLSNERLTLRYEGATEDKPDFCGDHDPAVTITFICPSSRQEGSPPKMTSKANCRYEIDWVTEYACHRDYLESHSCKLDSAQHDIAVDLSHLTLGKMDDPYHAKSSNGRDSYIYYLNVCGPIGHGVCANDTGFVSACQVKESGDMNMKITGRWRNQTLRYSDGDLTLTYPGGSRCSSGFQRMTIINFECNQTAENDGKGFPVFTGELDCTYYFEWQTAYACVKEKEDLLCQVASGKKRYDLSPLTRFPGSALAQNWEAVGMSGAGADERRVYLNMCHRVLLQGATTACPEGAAACTVDKNNRTKSLGSFLSAPQMDGDSIRLIYTEGDVCRKNIKTRTIISLKCSPGDVESAPLLRSVSSDECIYELEWHTSTACVLSKTEGDDCRVSDPNGGFSFDLSPLRKPVNEGYRVNEDEYDYFINVCDGVSQGQCPARSGACQVKKSDEKKAWSLGESNGKLSYYDGMIKLKYQNGSSYNDGHGTRRSSFISFLCSRDAGHGTPEFQKEDNHTYSFKWYTALACPERPHECLVTDPLTFKQYDLSSLSKTISNWEVMAIGSGRKYYINVCRPLRAVPGCARDASVCETTYEGGAEKVSISSMGVAKRGPIIQGSDQLLLEYTDGSICEADGVTTTYTTRIHLSCMRGTLASAPRFLSNQNCTANFIWHTKAACAIESVKDTNQTCTIRDPVSGFEFDLNPLTSKNGYSVPGNGRNFTLNICGSAPACSTKEGEQFAGCELEDGKPIGHVGVERSLEYSSEGELKLTYKGELDEETATRTTFLINFVCDNDDAGTLKFERAEMGTSTHVTHDVFFEFATPLACLPSPVDCQVTDASGNEYDLSDLSSDDQPYKPIDTSEQAKSQKFFLNVCKPLPHVDGCPAGNLGACAIINGRSLNLGYVQSTPQASDGSLSIVYQGGEACGAGRRYSTRIIFLCDDHLGSPIFDRKDGCEYVFIWRTSEACPIQRVQGENCKVTDPRSGHQFDLSPLSGHNYEVMSGQYEYHFAVCGGLSKSVCPHGTDEVSSCQVEGSSHRIAGLASQTLTYEDGLIMINYTHGEKCHRIYERSTAILFSCDQSKSPGQPEFIKETSDCTYMLEWHTALACPPFKTISCTYDDGDGNFYDLSSLSRSSLSLATSNWRAELHGKRFYLNVCKSLLPQGGSWACPSSAAACMKTEDDHYLSLGEAKSQLQWDKSSQVLVLRYTDGAPCPDDKERQKTTIIRFKCDQTRGESEPHLVSALEKCVYTFSWITAAACPLNATRHGDCRVTNPATGHVFDLSRLTKAGGYTIYDPTNSRKMIRLNVCAAMTDTSCTDGSAVCFRDPQHAVSGGKANSRLSYLEQVVQLTYEGGDVCEANPNLRHKSVISFVCRGDGDGEEAGEPVLVATEEDTCTHYFSWHTAYVCETQVRCTVWNGTALISLDPLVHSRGFYTATNADLDSSSTDFYINICQPLNPVPNVLCPPGAAVCMDPDDGPPIDIGRISSKSAPEYNSNTGEVEMTFSSNSVCQENKTLNYSSKIIFSCRAGTDLGTPQMIRKQQCVYVFEWATPVVCPEILTADGCALRVSELHHTFNLTSLSGVVQVRNGSSLYKMNVCGSITDSACQNSAVCQVNGADGISYGNNKAMSLDFQREDETIIMNYVGGDLCPPVTDKGELCVFPLLYNGKSLTACSTEGMTDGRPWCATTSDYNKDRKWGYCANVTAKRESSIIFSCNRAAGRGSPKLTGVTQGCSASFTWGTDAVCTPKKMECQLVSQHKTYDLRTLSSLTEPWKFSSGADQYYMNLCQSIHGGLTDCPDGAAVCRRSRGKTSRLGRVHTQTLEYREGHILVNYSLGDAVCGTALEAKSIIQLTCSQINGHPKLKRVDLGSCEFWIEWETRAACAVQQEEVKMVNGTITLPGTRGQFNLGALYTRLFQAKGDIRTNGDRYIYDIQLSGITNASDECKGAYICQLKMDSNWHRGIGSSNSSSKAKYYIKGGNLDVLVPSGSNCGRDRNHNASSAILFHCNPEVGEGIPEFLMETDLCQYLFVWHTAGVCGLFSERVIDGSDEDAESLSGRSQALGAVLSLLLVILSLCLLVLLLHKRERREMVIKKVVGCCKKGNPVAYKYSKVSTEENGEEDEMEWLMEELESPGKASDHQNGHVTTRADALRALPLDEGDSEEEDEVLTLPGVRIHSASSSSSASRPKPRARPLPMPALLREESDEDLVGLLEDQERRHHHHQRNSKAKTRSGGGGGGGSRQAQRSRLEQLTDDSDEDLLKV
ncbi:cation-independent mannose-6-phosphate receptor [Engraulis encrasicolus]|uniref:cation-independent mannose-6-phosphate receptor n=1 Tax=Engraulis encrasicolus TaxID=184585 RepID=UPI002FD381E6